MSRAGFFIAFLFFVALSWTNVPAWAQVDVSNSVLLRSGSNGGPSAEGLDTNRYKVREIKSKESAVEVDEEPSGASIPTPVSSKTVVKAKAEPTPAPSPAPAPQPVVTVPPEPVVAKPSVTTQVKELILGGNEDDIADYKNQIHPQDPRANVVEINLAPAYYYNDASSSYSFHNYNTHGPGYNLRATLWLTPFFGLQSDLFSSLSSGVQGGGGNVVPLDYQVWDSGIRFRKHFGYNRKSPNLIFGIDYTQSSAKIGKSATDVVGTKTSGVAIVLEGTVPSSLVYAHTFGLEIRPKLHMSETATSVSVKSGAKAETNGLGLSMGGQWTLDRRNQVFWKIRQTVERTLFEGPASQVDPKSGVTPDGVSVTNGLTMFYFGFRWGS